MSTRNRLPLWKFLGWKLVGWKFVGMAAALAATISSGCSRAHYRMQADQQGTTLTREKANHPHWGLDYFRVVAPPGSRMFDPYDPDHEPLPPDDPTAHVLMHRVDGKKGYKHWHKFGDTPFTQNPAFLDSLPLDENGVLVLSADEAVRTGFLNNTNYQSEMEAVYLSALDVSFERFRFDTQYFAGYGLDYTATGKDRAGNGGQSRSVLTAATFPGSRGFRSDRLFATGGELIVGFANSLVWQFSGPDDYSGRTLIDFSLIQPLLRDAGKARVLERLTRTERTLLYNVRSMERYRQGVNVQIMTGANPGSGPNRSGGVFGAGLTGFTGTAGGFGSIQTSGSTGLSQSGAAGAGAGQAGGYIGLLQTQQILRNQQDNILRLRNNAQQLETELLELLTTRAPTDTILRQRLQVAQARQALLNAQSTSLNSQNTFQGALDNFKAILGLPPQLCIQVVDPLIDEFQLIDRSTNDLQQQIQDATDAIGLSNRDIVESSEERDDPATGAKVRVMRWSDELRADLQDLRRQLEPMSEMIEQLRGPNLAVAARNIQAFENRADARKESVERLRLRVEQDKDAICALLPVKQLDNRVFDVSRFDTLPQRLNEEHQRLAAQFQMYPQRVQAVQTAIDKAVQDGSMLDEMELFRRLRDDVLLPGQNLLIDLRFDTLALQLLQARARTEAIRLPEVDMRADRAIEVARRYRHDWMNARGALVDQWRLIEFNANQLEGSLDVVFSGDVQNKSDNPLKLRGSTGRLSAGLQFDSPIVRVSERNVYRQTLIEYQQARRSYYQFEDSVARGLRQELRTLAANQINFELQRFAVLQAAEQITLNDDIRAHGEATAQSAGATAARDAVSALSDLLDAQNNFMSVFVNYEVQRRNLDLDLGTMKLDPEGIWLDPGSIKNDYGGQLYPQECELPPVPFSDDQIQRMIDWFDKQEAQEKNAGKQPEELPPAEALPEVAPTPDAG
jgi:hypothetical protein